MRRLPGILALMMPLAMVACDAGADTEEMDPAAEMEPMAEMEAEPQMDAAAVDAEMNRIRDAWISAAEAGDAAGIAALYAEDAVFVGATGDRMEGRQAIEQGMSQGLNVTSMEVTSLVRDVGPDLIADMGTYSQTVEGEQGEETVEGYYIAVSKRQADGSWKIVQHLGAPVEGAHSGDAMGTGEEMGGGDEMESEEMGGEDGMESEGM